MWSNLCMGNRSERGLWRCGAGREGRRGRVRARRQSHHRRSRQAAQPQLGLPLTPHPPITCPMQPHLEVAGAHQLEALLLLAGRRRRTAAVGVDGFGAHHSGSRDVEWRLVGRLHALQGWRGGGEQAGQALRARNSARWRRRQKRRLGGGASSRGFVSRPGAPQASAQCLDACSA